MKVTSVTDSRKNKGAAENIPEIDLDRDLEGEIPLSAL